MYHFFFFFNDTATTEIYTLSLHDALPIFCRGNDAGRDRWRETIRAPLPCWLACWRAAHRCPQHNARPVGVVLRASMKIGRAHVWTPVTPISRMPSSALEKKFMKDEAHGIH